MPKSLRPYSKLNCDRTSTDSNDRDNIPKHAQKRLEFPVKYLRWDYLICMIFSCSTHHFDYKSETNILP